MPILAPVGDFTDRVRNPSETDLRRISSFRDGVTSVFGGTLFWHGRTSVAGPDGSFELSPTDELHLILLTKDILKTLRD